MIRDTTAETAGAGSAPYGGPADAGSGGASPWRAWRTRLGRRPGALLGLAGVVTAALWFSHQPSLLLNAQFYADDGGWYQQASTQGPLLSLVYPAHGYLVLLQRAAASASLALPLVAVPTFFNLVALLLEIAGICYLLSPRMAAAIPNLAIRLALAALVIALPNAYDTSGNLTNAQWHLALIAFLVVFASPPRRLMGWLADGIVLVLSGLTGPYCILLEPIVVWRWRAARDDRHRRFVLVAVSVCTALELAVLVAMTIPKHGPSGLHPGAVSLITMLGRQLTLGLLAGAHGLSGLVGTPLGSNLAVLTLLALIPFAVCGWAAWRGPAILRAFCLFAFLELGVALAAPSIDAPKWPNLGRPADIAHFHPGGIRYFLYPLLAFAASLGWLAWTRRPMVRRRGHRGGPGRSPLARRLAAPVAVGAALLLLLAAGAGVPQDWLYPPYLDLHWAAQVQRLDAAPAGTRVVIPINPHGWTVTLVAGQR